MNKNTIKQLLNIIVPLIIFYGIYSFAGLIPAMIISLLFSLSNAAYTYTKEKKIPNTQLFGLIGLVLSLIGILFTDNEKLYYIPALASNCVFFCFAVGLTIKRKSICHYVAKDFKLLFLKNIREDGLFRLNLLWLMFFLLKIASKVIGILYLSFNQLYWLVFILGDPMTIALVVYSVYYINKAARAAQPANDELS